MAENRQRFDQRMDDARRQVGLPPSGFSADLESQNYQIGREERERREEAEHQKRLEKIRAESREKRERIRRLNDESEREENRRLRMEREVQFRNAHDYLKDFKDEKQVYEDPGKIIEFLDNWNCSMGVNVEDCMTLLAEVLVYGEKKIPDYSHRFWKT
ncbi:hypothetical protein CRE_18500 [Caenorhabditis remanei]|uniref:Uncharacterized protein n=1 Tax=Caenorhabditis remanei TaxID=31234 RepID=E3LKZ2_CAERE|nr:hypothetical protein CRE_18500 [Caenorhabditis remanei]